MALTDAQIWKEAFTEPFRGRIYAGQVDGADRYEIIELTPEQAYAKANLAVDRYRSCQEYRLACMSYILTRDAANEMLKRRWIISRPSRKQIARRRLNILPAIQMTTGAMMAGLSVG